MRVNTAKHYIPKCVHFNICGGCQFRNQQYNKQLALKQKDVSACLSEFNHPKINHILASPHINYYRNKMEYACGVWDGVLVVGLRARNTYFKIIPLTHCYLQSERSAQIISAISSSAVKLGITGYHRKKAEGILRYAVVREGKHTDQIMVNLITSRASKDVIKALCDAVQTLHPYISSLLWSQTDNRSDVAAGETTEIMYGQDYIEEHIGNIRFKISPCSFFQTNTTGAEVLYNVIKKYARTFNARVLLDMYCGAGGIGLCLSSIFKRVIGIENNQHAVADARHNMHLNNISNIEFHCLQAEQFNHDLVQEDFNHILAVVDPPRPGMDTKLIKFLCTARPAGIIYVSCNLIALKRDLQRLIQYYRISSIQPIDLFPHTPHVETVVVLKAR
ncbi:MAG: 23S rRNA (uracil(1939)-C(5))-methyltransferase RlmD [bacterium]